MNTVSLVLRIVAIIAGITAGALFFVSQGKLKDKHEQLVATQDELSKTTTSRDEAKAEAAALNGKLKTAERQGERLTTQLDTARTEADTTRRELNSAKSKLDTANDKIASLNTSVTDLNSKLSKAEQDVLAADKTEELAALNERIAALTTENTTIKDELNVAESKLKSYTAGREEKAPSVLTNYNTTEAVRSAKLADNVTIASVNSSNGIVVLDAAPELGLAPGMNVTLIQDLKALGRVRVAKVDDNFAVANILPGTSASRLKEGSVVDILR